MNELYLKREGNYRKLCLTDAGRAFLKENGHKSNDFFAEAFDIGRYMIALIRKRENLEKKPIEKEYVCLMPSRHGGNGHDGYSIRLTEAGVEYLKNNFERKTYAEIAKVMEVSISFVCCRCRELGLKKDFRSIVIDNIKKAREAFASKTEEERNNIEKRRQEAVRRAYVTERRRREIGYSMSDRFIPQFAYSEKQLGKRRYAHKHGYICGDYHDESERYVIYYDATTDRRPIYESNLRKSGLTLKEKKDGEGDVL